MGEHSWRVGALAELARVSVRTLHHYDEIGLLVPPRRSAAGYRLYGEAELARLYEILLYRELGLPLEQIARVLDAPPAERAGALRAHRDRLVERQRRTDGIIRAVDLTLASMEEGLAMSRDDMAEGFDAFANAPAAVREQQARYGPETRERWGDSEAYRESMRRAHGYSRDDWRRMQEEMASIEAHVASLMAAGADPDGDEATAAAETMREHIGRWFYPCSYRMHAGLADMYEADPRFAAHYDNRAEGLSAFIAAAIRANAQRAWQRGEE